MKMLRCQPNRTLPGVAVSVFVAVAATGCSGSGGEEGTDPPADDAVTVVAAALDGVRFDVRRDPG